MPEQVARAEAFRRLHVAGDPMIIFNAWDAGSAQAIAAAGARAIGTGSWSVAAAHGFADGEKMPLELAIANLARISHGPRPYRAAMKFVEQSARAALQAQ